MQSILKKKATKLGRTIWRQRYLLTLVLPGVVWLAIFWYGPMPGIVIAFKDFNPGLGIFGSPWAGLKYFNEIFGDILFWKALRNTFFFSVLGLLVGFPAPIIFALLINELVGARKYKRVIQTVSYLPHFLSWAFVASFLITFFSDRGTLNPFLLSMGIIKEPYAFMANVPSFIVIILSSSVWKSFGYSSIIYLAAMTSVDQEMYEAALIDGSSRFQQIWYITLPSIKPTIVILLILGISGMVSSNFEQFFLLQNAFVADIAKVLDVYTYEIGFQKARYSYGTAVGLFKSVVSFLLLISANKIAKRVTGESIY